MRARRDLLVRIMGVLSLTPVACGLIADDDASSSGAERGANESGSADANVGGTGTTADGTLGDSQSTSTFDATTQLDARSERWAECKQLATMEWVGALDGGPLCTSDAAAQPPYIRQAEICFPPPQGETCASAYEDECVLYGYTCTYTRHADSIACGPTVRSDGRCCWVVFGDCAIGRPFVVDGKARYAGNAPRSDWSERVSVDVDDLDAGARAVLADVWTREALSEHASIASFARFTLRLLELGAPADLVVRAQRAMLDETRHARICFGLASAYSGQDVGPSSLSLEGALSDDASLASLAAACVREGCIAETVAALQIRAAAEVCSVAEIRDALQSIADDEDEHVLLAWSFVRWALSRGDAEVSRAVARAFADAHQHVGFGAVARSDVNAEVMRAHGCLSRAERERLAGEAIREVIVPASRALLDALPTIVARA